jgi:hypothetical protein
MAVMAVMAVVVVVVMEVMEVIEDTEVQEEDDGGDKIGVIDIDHLHHYHYNVDLYGIIHLIGFQERAKQAVQISDVEDGVALIQAMDQMIVGLQMIAIGVDNSVTHFWICHSFLS